MIAKNNRRNSDFQIVYFLAGACHTADGAYALLCDLREDRKTALENVKAASLREQAKRLRAERRMSSDDEAERLEGKADLAEIEAFAESTNANIAAAQAELATIEKCIERLQPLRKYRDLPDAQAHQATQCEEWRLELIHRAENYLLTSGTIPADHLVTMRQHPAFATSILPAINRVQAALTSPDQHAALLTARPEFDVVKLLESTP